MTEISNLRLWVLRAAYLFVAVGLFLFIGPAILSHSSEWPLMNSVVSAMLGAVSILALVGVRYPLRMLPILLLLVAIPWPYVWAKYVRRPAEGWPSRRRA